MACAASTKQAGSNRFYLYGMVSDARTTDERLDDLDDEQGIEENPFFHFHLPVEELTQDDARDRRPRLVRRLWGIPTFTEQVDQGICSFVFRADHPSLTKTVSVGLEHRKHSTGSDLWDAALVLAHALYQPGFVETCHLEESKLPSRPLDNLNVLELGSGTGLVGLWAAQLGARSVTLTDLAENLDLVRRNVSVNNLEDQVSVLALDWTQPLENMPSLDLILGSDLFLPFAVHLLPALCETIHSLLTSSPQAQAIVCYEERFDCSDFFKHAKGILRVQEIANDLLHPTFQDAGRIHMMRITL